MLGQKQYELSNHLGNVLSVINDIKLPVNSAGAVEIYTAVVVSAQDYSPFGVVLKGRSWSTEEYRYGFGGHEKDDEVKGSGNHLAFGDYGLDTRLGRRWTVDKMASQMPNWSPYSFAKCNPILYLDADGQFPYTFHIRSFAPTGSFKGSGFHDDGRGYSTSKDVTSRIKQQFTVDPTAKTFSGGEPTSDPTYWNGFNHGTATNTGGASEFGKNSFGSSTASVGANFEGSNPSPMFMGMAPANEVSSAISITENLKTNQVFVAINLSSKQFPATEGLIQDNAGNTIFLAGAAAYGTAADLTRGDKKPIASVDLIIGINDKGVFQNVTMGDKTYSIEDFNKLGTDKPSGPLPREDKDKGGN